MIEHLQSAIVDLKTTGARSKITYQYMCRESGDFPPLTTCSKPVRLSEVKKFTAALSQVLGRLGVESPHSEVSGAELRDWGGKLYDKLVPQELATRWATEPDTAYLVLHLHPDLAWIPWELLWDGSQFLCRRFRLARVLQKTDPELSNAARQLRDEQYSGRGALIVFGDIKGLQADAEKEEVEKIFESIFGSSQVWFFRAKSNSDILEQLKLDYQICHFIGHGSYVEKSPADTGWKFADKSVLTCGDIQHVVSHGLFPRFIFANSCDSARPQLADAEQYISELYHAFLKKGVPHYIGTTARVPDALSRSFAHTFYRHLAGGRSVGEALLESRRTFAAIPGVPIWAYYVHYGDPAYRFVRSERDTGTRFIPRPAWLDGLEYDTPPTARERFVGRDKELREASHLLKRFADGKGGTLLVSGEAGVGKSALVQQLISVDLEDLPSAAAAVGTCNPQFGMADAYLPFKEIVRSLVRNGTRLAEPRDSALTIGELVISEFLLSFPQLVAVLRPESSLGAERWKRICQRLGLEAGRAAELDAEIDQSAIFDLVSRFFKHLAKSAPLILVIDNLHYADDSSIALFYHLGRTLSDSRVLLVGTYRPDFVTQRGSKHPLEQVLTKLRQHGARVISLSLSTTKTDDLNCIKAFVKTYLESVFPGHCLPASFTEKLVYHTGGNVRFLTLLLKHATEKGQIVLQDGKWQISSDVEHLELPDSVQALIEERIAELSKELRETLTFASVEGEDFTAEVLARLQHLEEDKVLDRLVDELHYIHQLIDERDDKVISPERVLSLFHFRNTLIQKHVYRGLYPARKRKLHKQVGEYLEDLYGDKRMEVAGQLAAHFRIAREWKKALGYAIEGARASTSIHANSEALRNYTLALELWELDPEKNLTVKTDLLLELGFLNRYVGKYAEAIAAYQQVLQFDHGDAKKRAWALNGVGDAHAASEDYAEALSYYLQSEAIANALQDKKLLIEVWTDFCVFYYNLWLDATFRRPGKEAQMYRTQSHEYGARVLQLAEEHGAWENLRKVYLTHGNILLSEGNFPETEEMYLKATTLAEAHKLVKKSLNSLGELRRLQGRYDEALGYYNAYLDWALKTGATAHELIAYHNIGMSYLAKEDFEAARDYFDKALELNTPLRHRSIAALSLAMKGFTFELQTALPKANELYRQSLAVAQADTDENRLYGTMGRMLFAYEPQPAAYFLSKYLEQSPPDAEEIRQMINKCNLQPSVPRATAA